MVIRLFLIHDNLTSFQQKVEMQRKILIQNIAGFQKDGLTAHGIQCQKLP